MRTSTLQLLLSLSSLLPGAVSFAFRAPSQLAATSSPSSLPRKIHSSSSSPISHCTNSVLQIVGSSSSVLYSQSQEDSESSLATPLDNPTLTALDIVALTGFAAVGKASHAPDGSIDFGAVLVTAFPFIMAWLATSPLTGIYKELDASNDENVIPKALIQTVKGWAVAVPLGCALRGVIKGYVPPVPFVIVTLIATLVILSTVRVVYALATEDNSS